MAANANNTHVAFQTSRPISTTHVNTGYQWIKNKPLPEKCWPLSSVGQHFITIYTFNNTKYISKRTSSVQHCNKDANTFMEHLFPEYVCHEKPYL